MNTNTYYDYSDLKKAYEANPTQENLKTLGEWFRENGQTYWNGEYFDADNIQIYPVYKEIAEDEFELAGYEAR